MTSIPERYNEEHGDWEPIPDEEWFKLPTGTIWYDANADYSEMGRIAVVESNHADYKTIVIDKVMEADGPLYVIYFTDGVDEAEFIMAKGDVTKFAEIFGFLDKMA